MCTQNKLGTVITVNSFNTKPIVLKRVHGVSKRISRRLRNMLRRPKNRQRDGCIIRLLHSGILEYYTREICLNTTICCNLTTSYDRGYKFNPELNPLLKLVITCLYYCLE